MILLTKAAATCASPVICFGVPEFVPPSFVILFSIGGTYRFSVKEFSTTETELNAIANPAISGRKVACDRLKNICPAAPNFCWIAITHGAAIPYYVLIQQILLPSMVAVGFGALFAAYGKGRFKIQEWLMSYLLIIFSLLGFIIGGALMFLGVLAP